MKATENWVCSGMISFKMPVVGRKIPQNSIIIVISICFSYRKCLEADENHSYFWMRQALPWPWHGGEVESGTERCSLGARPPPTECDFEGPHSKISAMGPEFLATALSAIMVSHPSTVYHLVFTPYSPFLTVTRLRSFSPHGGGRFSIGFSQTSPSSPGHRWCVQWYHRRPMSGICHTRRFFSKMFN